LVDFFDFVFYFVFTSLLAVTNFVFNIKKKKKKRLVVAAGAYDAACCKALGAVLLLCFCT